MGPERGSRVQGSSSQTGVCIRITRRAVKTQIGRAGACVVQVAKHFLSKYKALNSKSQYHQIR
jgi:hypothetical protein